MKMRMMTMVAAALLGAAVPVAAQQGGGSATEAVERLAERSPVRELLRDAGALGLSREQVRALEEMDRALSASADSAVAALRVAESGEQLAPGMRMREARSAILRAQGDAAERAWAILTPEQRQRLARSRPAP